MTVLVLIGGVKRSGKNTVATFIQRELYAESLDTPTNTPPLTISQASFAHPLKAIAASLYQWNGEKDHTPRGVYGRAVLQVLGDKLRSVPGDTILRMTEIIHESGLAPTAFDSLHLARRWFHFATRGQDTHDGKTSPTFDPLIERVDRAVLGRYTLDVECDGERIESVFRLPIRRDVLIVTDTRMPFEFAHFNPGKYDVVKVWLTREGTSSGSHVTEQLDPTTLPGVHIVENVNGNPYKAGGEVLKLVRDALARARGGEDA